VVENTFWSMACRKKNHFKIFGSRQTVISKMFIASIIIASFLLILIQKGFGLKIENISVKISIAELSQLSFAKG
jgi:hypothetical protein